MTETGTEYMGTVKSAMGIGGLLCMGIGDTIRVSLTADPVREVVAAKAILKAAGLRKDGVNIVSCPTCGRTQIDLIGLAGRVEEALRERFPGVEVMRMDADTTTASRSPAGENATGQKPAPEEVS